MSSEAGDSFNAKGIVSVLATESYHCKWKGHITFTSAYSLKENLTFRAFLSVHYVQNMFII